MPAAQGNQSTLFGFIMPITGRKDEDQWNGEIQKYKDKKNLMHPNQYYVKDNAECI